MPWSKALEKFQRVYGDRFSYDENTYDGMKCEMSVHCNVCGETFRISPVHHLKYNNGGCPNCHKHRIVKCSCCGKEIEADWHINGNIKIYCEECRYKNILLRKYKYKLKDKNFDIEEKTKTIINSKHFCKICGRPLNEKQECDNEFCKNKNFERFGSLIKYFNFDKNKLGTVYVEIEFNRIRNVLYDMYWIQHMSST